MWQIERAPLAPTSDLRHFIDTLNRHTAFFRAETPIIVARAPGRLDLMGGIADYSGALVLQLPLGLATFAAVQISDQPHVTIRSLEPGLAVPELTFPLAALFPAGEPLGYAAAHALLTADPLAAWAAYVAGVLVVLGRERSLLPSHGLRILIASDVPAGKGVSSSAAIEVATMAAVVGATGHEQRSQPTLAFTGHELALLCQLVENRVVGAPCGVMDQMASSLGQQGQLLALICQPAEVQGTVALPPDVAVWGIDSGIRHAVSGADYGSVRVGAFMGRRILQERGVFRHQAQPGSGESDYLAQISPSQWEQHLREQIPIELSGVAFLAQYSETGDSVTSIDPARTYAVRQPTAHPIYEHQRVQLFRALLEADSGQQIDAGTDAAARHLSRAHQRSLLLGELMFQSHASYGACGLGSEGTDRLVELVRGEREHGLYGAKITGGGSGGTVAVLGQNDAGAAVQRVAAAYAAATGHTPLILSGSSPGAAAWGTTELRWRA